MKTAKEMFEELGFYVDTHSEEIGIYEFHKDIKFDGYSTKRVHFDLRSKLYYVYYAKGNNFGDFGECEVTIELHNALTQQMKELGWLE